jgi:hypothetical protein
MKKRLLLAALGIGAALSILGIPHTQYGHPDPVGPTVYSKSAIGHAALFELLRRLEIPVTASEGGSGHHGSPGQLLVIAEPRTGPALDDVRALLVAQNVLLVLPKRTGTSDPHRPNWLGRDRLVSEDAALDVLHLVDENATLTRGGSLDAWPAQPFAPGHLSIAGAQLIHSKELRPLLQGPEGILAGDRFLGRRHVTVLADPDLLANFSLERGDNSVAAVNLIVSLRNDPDSAVIFDEFEHGFAERPFHMLGIFFQFPFALVTLQIAIAAALLVWAAGARFGAPAPLAEPIAAGKRSLIEAGARLLDRPQRMGEVSARYVEAIIRDAGNTASPLPQLTDGALGNAQRIYLWRKELSGEPRERLRHR